MDSANFSGNELQILRALNEGNAVWGGGWSVRGDLSVLAFLCRLGQGLKFSNMLIFLSLKQKTYLNWGFISESARFT